MLETPAAPSGGETAGRNGTGPAVRIAATAAAGSPDVAGTPVPAPVLRLQGLHFWYGSFRAVKDVSIDIPAQRITALIGPSGCGKSTLLRTMNRMNDLIPGTRVEGTLL